MTIKHLLYTQLCAFMYTEGACVVFFRFWNSPMKIFYVIETVASISDQREYLEIAPSNSSRVAYKKIVAEKRYRATRRRTRIPRIREIHTP